jgi:hypothetical protein
MNERPLDTYRGFTLRVRPAAPDPAGPQHVPSRPDWACQACAEPWPCAVARDGLTAELTGTRLAMVMWTYLEKFVIDQGAGPLKGAFDRFIAWTRRPNPPA